MIREKSYFQSSPTGSQYTLFNTGNKPDKTAFGDLFDSIPFKTNVQDTATESAQGLVLLMSDANAEVRTLPGSGLMVPVALAHQMPMLIVAGTTEIGAGANASNGIKISGISITHTGRTRLSYKLEFDPASLATVTTIADTDYVVVSIGGVPKKITLGNGLSGYGTWQRSSLSSPAVISPVNAGDILQMGIGRIYAAGLSLNTWPTSTIQPIQKSEDNGGILGIIGGNAVADSNPFIGGHINIYGGLGCNAGLPGDVRINYDGNTSRGHLGIATAADTVYQVKILGSLWVTGAIRIGLGGLPSGPEYVPYINTSGELAAATPKTFMDKILGVTLSAGAVAVFNGTTWVKVDVPAAINKFFGTDGSGAIGFNSVSAGLFTNTEINANAGIVFTKMAALDSSMIPQIGSTGFIESSDIASSKLGFIANLTSDAQTQINALHKNVTSTSTPLVTATVLDVNTINDIIPLNVNGSGFTTTLPLISTLMDGQMVTFHQYGANTATLAGNAGDNGFIDSIMASQTTITVGGNGKWVTLRCNAGTKTWTVMMQG